MTMNYPDAAAADPWCCYNNEGEAAAAVPTSWGETGSFFAEMAADYSTDDLFELVWEQQGQDGGAPGSMQPAVSCLSSSSRFNKPPDVRFEPPSEDEMAAWLYAVVVKGDERRACNDDDGCRRPMADDGPDVGPAMGTSSTSKDKKENAPAATTTTTEGMMMGNKKEMRKTQAKGSSRRCHHGEAHNLTEKRRRHKINERFKTLQQLVPGCSKSNQASTLDQTIHYMKSLQNQVHAMSVGLAAPGVYPVVQPRCVPPAGRPVAMPFPAAPMVIGRHPPSTIVPFGTTTMLQLPHYPAEGVTVMVPAIAAVGPLYPAPAAAAPPTSIAVAPGDAMSAKRLHGSKERAVAASLFMPV